MNGEGPPSSVQELLPGFEPERDIERALVAEPDLRRGDWFA